MVEDHLQKILDNPNPFALFLGINYNEASKDQIKCELKVRTELCSWTEIFSAAR